MLYIVTTHMMVYSLSKIYPKTYPDPYKSTSCMFRGFVLKSTSCMFCGGVWGGVEVVWRWCSGSEWGVDVFGGVVRWCSGVWRCVTVCVVECVTVCVVWCVWCV